MPRTRGEDGRYTSLSKTIGLAEYAGQLSSVRVRFGILGSDQMLEGEFPARILILIGGRGDLGLF